MLNKNKIINELKNKEFIERSKRVSKYGRNFRI